MSLRALGGDLLVGNGLARSAYLDEAGISNPLHEPIVAVAGVIVHTDNQWRALHEHFNQIVKEFIPAESRDGFIFHAKDIWHGNKIFNRAIWKGVDRRTILHTLCDIIPKFQLPVVWGHSDKRIVAETLKEDGQAYDPKTVLHVSFMSAFADCAVCAEKWMRIYGGSECMNLIVENNSQLQKFTKGTFRELKKLPADSPLIHLRPEDLPIKRIIDAPSFMDKDDAPPLQLADVCAFVLKRYFGQKPDVAEYIVKLLPSMLYALDQQKLAELMAKLENQTSQQSTSSPS